MRSTHSLATMAVPGAVFETVHDKLVEAGYHHAILDERDGVILDMTGIGMVRDAGPPAPTSGRVLQSGFAPVFPAGPVAAPTVVEAAADVLLAAIAEQRAKREAIAVVPVAPPLPDGWEDPTTTLAKAIIVDADNRGMFKGIDQDIRDEIVEAWLALARGPEPKAQAVPEPIVDEPKEPPS